MLPFHSTTSSPVARSVQDSWTGVDKLGGSHTLLLGVFDGHGSQGHCVSRNVAAFLPRTLASCPLQHPQDCQDALAASLPECNQQLRRVSTMDCDLSGCTAVVSLLSGRNLVVANLGDSRCVGGGMRMQSRTG
jgi:serine/threonine protein phosphatase PrpC